MILNTLIADNYRYFLLTLQKYLDQFEGLSVVATAGNGWEAVEYAKKYKPDLIVMDINMHELDGLKVCRLVKADQPEIKVILYTMDEPGPFKEEAESCADILMSKDSLFDELPAVLDKMSSERSK